MSQSDEQLNSLISSLTDHFQKRLAEMGETDPEKVLQEVSDKKKEFLKNTIPDHLGQWQMKGEPVLAGDKFVITRSWQTELVSKTPEYQSRKIIKVDPGLGFGFGHGTTLACIKALEKYWQGGKLLDVGTGTGVLAIVANHLHPESQIDAFDIYEDVVEQADISLEMNNVKDKINLSLAKLEDFTNQSYDFVTANLLAQIVVENKDSLFACVKPGGILVLSGIADKAEGRTYANFGWQPTISTGIDADSVAEEFVKIGMNYLEKIKVAEWVALVMQRP